MGCAVNCEEQISTRNRQRRRNRGVLIPSSLVIIARFTASLREWPMIL